MVVSTTAGGRPSSRTVLLKEVNAGGFVFFTNYASRKASEMAGSSYVALLFGWYPLHRQVRVEGRRAGGPFGSEAYFASRPRALSSAPGRRRSRAKLTLDELIELYRQADERLRERTCPARSTGVATGFARRASSSGRVSPAECMTGCCRRVGDGWQIVRLAPRVSKLYFAPDRARRSSTRSQIHHAVQSKNVMPSMTSRARLNDMTFAATPTTAAAARASDSRDRPGRSSRTRSPIPSHHRATKMPSSNCQIARHHLEQGRELRFDQRLIRPGLGVLVHQHRPDHGQNRRTHPTSQHVAKGGDGREIGDQAIARPRSHCQRTYATTAVAR